jgi:hypothetical protein
MLLLVPSLLPVSLLLSVSRMAAASVPVVADILATENVFLLITDGSADVADFPI